VKILKRKPRSDKFPLTLHPTGQYCKKIKGKMYYFGSDKKQALERYLDQATYLHGCQDSLQQPTSDNMTLKQLCDMYLKYQYSKLQSNDLTASHHNEQISSLNKLMAFCGQNIDINNISTLDLQNYKRRIQKCHVSACRLNLHISIMKALFHWARKNDVLESIPNIDAISRGKIIHQERFTFNSEQVNKLLSIADVKMRAMIWLGLNCGFGCTDCSELKWTDLDLANNRVKLARKKLGFQGICRYGRKLLNHLKRFPEQVSLFFILPEVTSTSRCLLSLTVMGTANTLP